MIWQTLLHFRSVLILITTALVRLTSQNYCLDNVGTEFVVAFMESPRNGHPLQLYIATQVNASATVEITTPTWNSIDKVNMTVEVAYQSMTTVNLPQGLRLTGSAIDQKVVHVIADNTIALFASVLQSNSGDTMMIFPIDILGQKYVSLNFLANNGYKSTFAFAAIFDNTTVSVYKPAHGSVFVNSTVTLDKYEAYQMIDDDLTGTIIESNEPIAGFSGHTNLRYGSTNSADHIFVQLIPVNLWTTEYIVVPWLNDTDNDQHVRVVSYHKNTTVQIEQESIQYDIELEIPGSYHEIVLPAGKWMTIKSDKGISVGQLFPNNPDELYGDASLLIPSSPNNFKNSYQFPTPHSASSDIERQYVVLISNSNTLYNIIFDGANISSFVTWASVGASGYFFTTFEITSDYHSVYSTNLNGIFGGYLRGTGNVIGYSNSFGNIFENDESAMGDIDEGNYRTSEFRLIVTDQSPATYAPITELITTHIGCHVICISYNNCRYLTFNAKSGRCRIYDGKTACGQTEQDVGSNIYGRNGWTLST